MAGKQISKRKAFLITGAVSVLTFAIGLAATSHLMGGDQSTTGNLIGYTGSTHEHANLTMYVMGDRINFSHDMYQLQDRNAHFEMGDGVTLHKHAIGVTLGYSLETLGMELEGDCLTFNGTEYCENSTHELSVTLNGRPLDDPSSFEVYDGNNLMISYRGR